MTNLFAGAILNTFMNMEKEANSKGGALMTDDQRNWVQLQKAMLTTKPKNTYTVPTYPFREYVFRFCINSTFTFFMAVVIMANIVIMCMNYFGEPESYGFALDVTNAMFMGFFLVEMLLKWIALGFAR
jgi:hypothetical protein